MLGWERAWLLLRQAVAGDGTQSVMAGCGELSLKSLR